MTKTFDHLLRSGSLSLGLPFLISDSFNPYATTNVAFASLSYDENQLLLPLADAKKSGGKTRSISTITDIMNLFIQLLLPGSWLYWSQAQMVVDKHGF